jgi:hypothetical protein
MEHVLRIQLEQQHYHRRLGWRRRFDHHQHWRLGWRLDG